MPEDLGAEITRRLSRDLVKEPIDPRLFDKTRLRERIQQRLEQSRRVAREATAATLAKIIRG